MGKRLWRWMGRAAALLLAMVYGMLVDRLQWPPYGLVREVEVFWTRKDYLETPTEYLDKEAREPISIERPEDVDRLRRGLIAFLWGRAGLPTALPSRVLQDFEDSRFGDLAPLDRIERIEISMGFGLQSCAYHFIPKAANHHVVLYHEGHRGDFLESRRQIGSLLEHGYAVVALSMPLLGQNNQPTLQLPRLGRLKLTSHDHMKFLAPERGHPVQYFLEPVVVVLNYLEANFAYSSISMVGISGGGWTTTLAAAVDPRIGKSFPVAGSYPIYLRSGSRRDWGDFEQTAPELYETVNYLELYVLGAYGERRKQLQILNQYDSCCFAGTKWETYEDLVRTRVQRLGQGEFDLFLDSSHKGHGISAVAMDRILAELCGNEPQNAK